MADILIPIDPTLSTVGGNGGKRQSGQSKLTDPRPWRVPSHTYHTGMWTGLSAILMLFAAFTSAMVVRKGASGDWVQTQLPSILYWNGLLLFASSITLEIARSSVRRLSRSPNLIISARLSKRYGACLSATLALGVLFIAGQLFAWHALKTKGVFLESNPSSSFFYLLTASHGLHLLGGIIALLYLVSKIQRTLSSEPGRLRTAVDVISIYWHFLDGLWLYILVLLIARL